MVLAAADIHGVGTEDAGVSYELGAVDMHGVPGAEVQVSQIQQREML